LTIMTVQELETMAPRVLSIVRWRQSLSVVG